MRVTDVFLAFPALLLALALAVGAAAQPDQPDHRDRGHLVAVVHPADPRPGRVGGRAAVRRELPGAGHLPAAGSSLRHILPNSVTPLIVQVSLDVGGVILHRVGAVVPRPRRAGPDAGLGADGGRGAGLLHHRTGGSSPSPAWRSWSPRSRSTCSATGCATCSTRGGRSCDELRRWLEIADLEVRVRRPAGRRRSTSWPRRGEIVGLAGESGSGKSMTTLAVLGLARTVGRHASSGSITARRAAS